LSETKAVGDMADGFYKRIPGTHYAIRLPRRLGIILYSRAVAKAMLSDDVLAFYVCQVPNCPECAEIAKRSSICAYRETQ
jgi:hypothetical protein